MYVQQSAQSQPLLYKHHAHLTACDRIATLEFRRTRNSLKLPLLLIHDCIRESSLCTITSSSCYYSAIMIPSRSTLPSLLCTILCLRVLVLADLGLRCMDHPAAAQVSNPVLIRSWEYFDLRTAVQANGRVDYHPRFNDFNYCPVNDLNSTKYHGLDLFVIGGVASGASANAVQLYFQRPAVVFMFVNAYGYNRKPQEAVLKGWKSEGWVELLGHKRMGNAYRYGIFQKSKVPLSQYAYVFSKPSGGASFSFVAPHPRWVRSNVRGIRVRGSFHLRIAEKNLRPSRPPSKFRTLLIEPNSRCPDVLHDSWGTYDDNPDDKFTKGKRFGSWHPQWDPCFWW